MVGSSLIRVHGVCSHGKDLNIRRRRNKQMTFSGQKYWQDKGLSMIYEYALTCLNPSPAKERCI